MIGFAFLALTLLPQQTLSPDEIKARLERPVTLQTDPMRLPVVLDQLGGLVGVHIRTESLLNRAVVVVSVRNKPAKDVFAKLINGIGAGSIIQNGEIVVGMEVATPEEAAKFEAEYARTLKGWSDNLYKSRSCDEEVDQKALDRIVAAGLLDLQTPNPNGSWYRAYNQNFFQTLSKTPVARFVARLTRIVGPELLSANPKEDSLYLSMRDLSESKQGEVLNALGILRQEQDTWAKTFAQLKSLAGKTGNYYLQPQVAEIEPMDKAALTGFKLSIFRKDRFLLAEVMSGNTPVLEAREYIPSKRQRNVRVEGDRFDLSKAPVFNVPAGDRLLRFFKLANPQPNEVTRNDLEVRRMLADAWKNDPLSFSRIQPLAKVAEKLDLNLVAYLSDPMIGMMMFSGQVPQEIPSREILQYLSYSGPPLKKDDWLTVPCYDPESYLRRQMDRAALGKFLMRALKPGCLSLPEYGDSRVAIGRDMFQIANALAEIVQPGFQSLNSFGLMLDFYSELNFAQRSQLTAGGIPIASLSPKAKNYVVSLGQSAGGYRRPGDPEDLYTDPPTKNELMRARVVMRIQQSPGLLTHYNDNGDPNFYSRYSGYTFQNLDDFQGQPARAVDILNSLPSPFSRLCHRTERLLTVDIPRRQGVRFTSWEYDADLSVPSVPRERLREPLIQYLGG